MRATTILAIVTIVAALVAVTSWIPVQHSSAAGQPENFPGASGTFPGHCGGSGGGNYQNHFPPFCT